jgi:thiol-disulfide isomerase/thioredoxin
MFKKSTAILFALVLVLSACAPATSTPEVMMEKPTEAMMEKPTEAMAAPDSAATPEMASDKMMADPAWFGATLTNVRDGQNFTINDFKGKVVLVEMLAMWCPNCKKQQGQVKAYHEALGMNEDLVSIGLDVDPNENATDLKTYTDNNGFDWIYAVAPVEVAREIGSLYGDQFLNPSPTPILIIDRNGDAHPMPFGIKSAADLMKFIEPFLQAEM